MYAIYSYNAGSTIADVASDVFAILTGETNKTNLSASCNQTNTVITSTDAAGWTVYDASAGTNYKVLRAINTDATSYKYFGLKFTNSTVLDGYTYDTWNSGTHTGTNQVTASNSWDASAGGYFYIYATERSVVVLPYVTGSGYKNLSGTLIFELNGSAALVTGGNYSKHVWCYNSTQINSSSVGSTQAYMPRVKNTAGTGDGQSVTVNIAPVGAVQVSNSQFISYNPFYRDASENVYVQLSKFGVMYQGIYLGESYDIFTCPKSSINTLDEVVYSGNTYVAFVQSTFVILFKKG